MSASDRGQATKTLTRQQTGARDPTPESASGDNETSLQTQAPALRGKQPPASTEAAVTGQQGHIEQPSPYDLRDLTAQEDMAFWAMWMFVAALATLIVTSVGTILIWGQVKLTRKAVEDTGKATLAMEGQNELARESMERQLRAYVFSHGLGWEIRTNLPESGFRMLIWSEWQNLGQTPTRALKISFVHKIFEAGHGCMGIAVDAEDSNSERHQLGPGQQVRSQNFVVSEDDVEAIYRGQKQLFVAGLAEYHDAVTDKRRETRISYRVEFLRDRSLPLEGMNIHSIAWEIIGSHNCADDECEKI